MPKRAPRQQLEGGIRAVIGIALGLALLHLAQQRVEARVVLGDVDADALQFGQQVRLAGLVGDQHLAAVAHRLGRHVLVGLGLLHDGRGMDAGLGGEGALAHIGRLAVGRAVQQLVEGARDWVSCGEPLVVDAGLEARRGNAASAPASG